MISESVTGSQPHAPGDSIDPLAALATSDADALEALTRLDEGHETGALVCDKSERLAPLDRQTLMRVKLLARDENRPVSDVVDDLLGYAIERHDVALRE